jgi:nucleotide-binding universal stress UspA family protein
MTDTVHDTATEAPRTATHGAVVVVMDGSYAAGEALLWANRLTGSVGGDLVAVRTWRPGLGNTSPRAAQATVGRLRRELHRWCDDALHVDDEPATEVVEDGDPGVDEVLGHHALELVVTGIEASANLDLHGLGGFASHLAVRSGCPLAVVPTGGAGRVVHEVVVGLDGSARSLAACEWVARHAAVAHWHVHALTVYEPLVEFVAPTDPRSLWSQFEHALEGPWTAPLREAGVPYTTELVEGVDHIDAMTQATRRRHADAIAVGTIGNPRRLHHKHGSTGLHLVHEAHLPVIIVPGHDPRLEAEPETESETDA